MTHCLLRGGKYYVKDDCFEAAPYLTDLALFAGELLVGEGILRQLVVLVVVLDNIASGHQVDHFGCAVHFDLIKSNHQ